MKKTLWIVLLVILCGAILPVKSAFAIDPPQAGTLNIVNTTVYGNLSVPGDMLFLVEMNIGDKTYFPTDYTVDKAYLVRLMTNNGTSELVSVAPFNNPYFHNGYGHGVIGMYFTADQASTLGIVFGSTSYSMIISGNPAIAWNGTVPTTLPIAVGNWNNTNAQSSLYTRIIALGNTFRSDWNLTFNLTDSGALTADGSNYFLNVIPNLRLLCPQVFTGYLAPIQYHKRTITLTYALTLRNQWAGTWLQMDKLGKDWGVDPIWPLGLTWLLVIFAACWGVASISNSNKGIYYVVLMSIAVGGLIGFLPWSAFGLAIVVTALIIVNELWFSKSLQ